VADGIEYTAVCQLCTARRPIDRAEVATGRIPVCQSCEGPMIVHGRATTPRTPVKRLPRVKP
jgi:hypothetical protein